ncbi:MAG TPA: efflux RND transporter periplasmic adaptor subunit [Bryobacteraceae bacterium]|nr:efflux RND transporter periplasmic adaptor subunit [Bryobacteraceae bacterium]
MLSSKPLAATVAACFLLGACHEAPRKAEAIVSQPVPANTVAAAAVEWPSISEAVGTVRARASTVISSKVMGYVREVKVHVGDTVSAGELLVSLDSRDLDASWKQAQAARQEAADAGQEVTNAMASAKANLDFAQATFRRMDDLYQKKSISDQEYDEATSKLKVAQAAYDMSVAKRAQLAAKLRQADEGVNAAAVMRGYSEMRAPFSGIVTEKPVEPGVLATPGAPLLTIEQTGALRLEVPVDETFLADTRVGQAVTVRFDALNRTLQARVSETVPSVDAASRAFVVKIDLPVIPNLRSGVYGKAQFARGTRQVIAVPAVSVAEQGQVQSVMVDDGGIARTRLVTTGQKQGDEVEILSGLNVGDLVVSPRPPALADGARLEARP